MLDAVRAGASGYLLKDSPADALIAVVEGTAAGKTHIDPSVAGKLIAQLWLLRTRLGQTPRSPRSCALTGGTERNHVSAILGKLGVTDRTQAALLALRHGVANSE